MGGSGSGTWYRHGSKTKTNEVLSLSISYLRKSNILHTGYSGAITWSRNGVKSDAINIRTYENKVILSYNYKKSYETEWKHVDQEVKLTETDCNYGGVRKWFICPHCGCRAGVIYSAQKYFLCRKCNDLIYSSQCESEWDRHASKAKKIRKRLNAPDNLIETYILKPKYMRWKTYDRLIQQERYENTQATMQFVARYGSEYDMF